MDHPDHVALLRPGIAQPGGVWADLGAGRGAFTQALAELLVPGSVIYVVDRDSHALRDAARALDRDATGITFYPIQADFTRTQALPPLDGVVMANSLHFVRDKQPVITQIRSWLKPGGVLIVVEYNTDQGNRWVPHPFSFPTWQRLAAAAGFAETSLLATRPSRFLGEIYSARSRS